MWQWTVLVNGTDEVRWLTFDAALTDALSRGYDEEWTVNKVWVE